MDWDKFRELYSYSYPGGWDTEYNTGSWELLEKVPVGVPQLHPSNELPWFTKVDQGSDIEHIYGGGNVWMIVSYGTTSDTVEYWKISGWANSYGDCHWNDSPTRVNKKTKTEVFYE